MASQALVRAESLTRHTGTALGGSSLGRDRHRVELAGIHVDQVDLAAAVQRMRGFLWSGTPHQVVTVNLDFLRIAEHNPRFRETINHADLAVADGMPLVWGSRLKGQPLPERVTGVELVDEGCRLAAQTGHGVFLLGAAPGVAQAAGRTLQERFPGLKVHIYSPPFGSLSREENDHIVEMIRAAAPGLLFVAFGAPRQDLWIRSHLERLQVPVAMGVGCVLDLLAGTVNRAPVWMQRSGLEWAFRLRQEPARLWRRYLRDMPVFARLMAGARSDSKGPLAMPELAAYGQG